MIFRVRKSICDLPLAIYKLFMRLHLDYGDIIYGKAYNTSFHQKLEKIQYNSALAITGPSTKK